MRPKFNVIFPVRLRPEHVKTIERAAAVSGDCPSALVRRGGLAEEIGRASCRERV